MSESSGPTAGFTGGFLSPLNAVFLLLRRRGLKRYALLPLAANVVLYALAVAAFLHLVFRVHVNLEWDFWGPIGGWLSATINWSFDTSKWLLAVPFALVVSYFTFTTVGMIIAAPFNEMLSERVERAICRPREEVSLPLTLTGAMMVLGIVDAVGILVRQVFWMLIALPLLLVPGVGFLPLFLVMAYFTGLGFFDVPMARNHLRPRHRKPGVRRRWWALLGLGVALELLFLVPGLGLLVLPVGTTAGTILYCRTDWEELLTSRGLERPRGFVAPVPRT